MGKITVKHYLNTNLKPKKEKDLLLYPIYLQVIYNKFSTNKKSYTEIYTTIEGFNYYLKNGSFLKSETIKKYEWLNEMALKDELENFEYSLKIADTFNQDIKRYNIFPYVYEFSRDVNDYMQEIIRTKLSVQISMKKEENQDIQYDEFLLCFSGNIINSINYIKEFSNIDFYPYIKDDDKFQFMALKEIENISKQLKPLSFAKFVNIDYKSLIKNNLKNEKIETYDKILSIIDDFIYWGVLNNTYGI